MSPDPNLIPPKLAQRFLYWFLRDELAEEVEGDLEEQFYAKLEETTIIEAKLNYWYQVLHYLRPFAIRRSKQVHLNQYAMFQNYFKIGWRNLIKNKGYSFINISGLSIGMAVAILIGLWVYDELSFNKHFENHDSIAKVTLNYTLNGEVRTGRHMSLPMGPALKNVYTDDFKYVLRSTFTKEHALAFGEKIITQSGNFMENDAPHMLAFNMLQGTRDGLKDPYSIMLSATLASIIFGDEDPLNKVLKIDGKVDVKVTGVYEDLPHNSEFAELAFIAPWELNIKMNPWQTYFEDDWNNNFLQIFVQIAPHTSFDQVSAKIKNIKLKHSTEEVAKSKKFEVFLHPMDSWHLFNEFENGKISGGLIRYVWLFGSIGVFVLLLACINFTNLSTARSEKRAKEVGIRKSIGSEKKQLIIQFFTESFLVIAIAFLFSLLIVYFALPFFNQVADKKIAIAWGNPVFWFLGVGFSVFTCLLAGSYPAFYLSAFQPIKALKGAFKIGMLAIVQRKTLVVLQFSVSTILIIGTIIVYRQIQFTQNRPVGYDGKDLIYVNVKTDEIHKHYDAFRNEMLNTKSVIDVAESNGSLTEIAENNGDFTWSGKDSDFREGFGVIRVSYDYGNTVGWEFIEGRDFSRDAPNDAYSLILNESAVKLMGLANPVGEIIKHAGKDYEIIGVVKDMVMRSPYSSARQSIFSILPWQGAVVSFKLKPNVDMYQALSKIETVFKKYVPYQPFDYKFVDQEYAKKFSQEKRIGSLAAVFAILAIFISCLGLFGLASYIAERRTKEIGIRKVIGASIFSLWKMLSQDFVVLVLLANFIAAPIAYYFLNRWLEDYEYRIEISWWAFALAGLGALLITLLTVSYQAIKAALMNPIKSLKSE
ncbi:MAG: ABC transporter permease [Bacteroidota bacterium]